MTLGVTTFFCIFVAQTADVAQLVEPQIVTLVVAGSSPVIRPHARHDTDTVVVAFPFGARVAPAFAIFTGNVITGSFVESGGRYDLVIMTDDGSIH